MINYSKNIGKLLSPSLGEANSGWKAAKGDKVIWAIVVLLVLMSLLVVYSTTSSLA